MSKVQGNIVDLLMPPLSDLEIVIAFTLAGITRGIVVAIATAAVMIPFVNLQLHIMSIRFRNKKVIIYTIVTLKNYIFFHPQFYKIFFVTLSSNYSSIKDMKYYSFINFFK